MAEPARQIDVIDARPVFTQGDADALNARFEGVDTLTMLKTVFAEGLAGNVGVVSSFGTESAVLLDLVAKADKAIPVIFVDTQKMFAETLNYRDMLVARLGFTNSSVVAPDAAVLAKKDETGLRWSYDPDGCCEIRKVEPMKRAKASLDAWISGRKAFQSVTRQNLPRFEVEDGRLKINPLGIGPRRTWKPISRPNNCRVTRWRRRAICRSAANPARPRFCRAKTRAPVAGADGTRWNAVSIRR